MDRLPSWPNDWPIQSDDPLRGWSLRTTTTTTASAVAGGAGGAATDTSDANKNAAAAPRRRGKAKAINEDDEGEGDDDSSRSSHSNASTRGSDEVHEDDSSDHLCPGGILKEMGTADVHWARGASTTSTKKYLVILPGLLSLNRNHTPATSSSSVSAAAAAAPTSTPASVTGSAAAISSIPSTILGRFRPPDTSTLLKSDAAAQSGATLELCLGHDNEGSDHGGALRLEGQAVKTTGKFLWITNLQKKKKTVTCKHVFDSILVFGNARSVGGGAPAAASDDASTAVDDSAVDHVPLHHYGASRRTVDGGNHLVGMASASTPNKKMFAPKPVRVVPVATSSAATPASNDAKPAPWPGKRSHKDLEGDETDSEHSSRGDGGSADRSSSSDDEDNSRRAHADARGGAGDPAVASPPSTQPDSSSRRRRSVRASARAPVRYKEAEEEEEAVDHDADEDDDVLSDDSEAAMDLADERGTTNAVTTGRKRRLHQEQKDAVADLTHADDVSTDLPSQKTTETKKRRLPIQEAAVADHADAVETGSAASPAIGMSKGTKRPSRGEAKEYYDEADEVQSPTTMGSMAKATRKPAAKRTRGAFGRSLLDLAGDESVTKAGRGNFGHDMARRRSADEEAVDDTKPVSSSPSLSANGSASPRNNRNEESPHKRSSSSAKKPSDLEMAVMAESAAAPSPAKSPSTALTSPAPPPPSTSPLSASPAHLRIRTTPRPMKKTKKSVLDYIKDDAFD